MREEVIESLLIFKIRVKVDLNIDPINLDNFKVVYNYKKSALWIYHNNICESVLKQKNIFIIYL